MSDEPVDLICQAIAETPLDADSSARILSAVVRRLAADAIEAALTTRGIGSSAGSTTVAAIGNDAVRVAVKACF
jgi:hypothetical protein